MPYCTKCGALIAAQDVRFCAACGTAVVLSPSTAGTLPTPSTDADGAETPVKQRYAWALLVVPLLSIVVSAAIGPTASADWGGVLLSVFAFANLALMFADCYTNNAEMTLFRFLVGFFAAPIWLWMRGKVMQTTRTPFWIYVGVWTLPIVVNVVKVWQQVVGRTAP
jgi:hypothetical protein